MKRILALWLLAVTAVYLLSGCRSVDSSADDARVTLTNVYAAAPLSAPDHTAFSSEPVFIRGDRLYLFSGAEHRLYTFDQTGSYLADAPIAPADGCTPLQIQPYGDGYVQFGKRNSEKNTYVLARTDADGNTVCAIDVESVDFLSILGAANDEIYLFSGSNAVVYDENLTVQAALSLPVMPSEFRVVTDPDGTETAYLLDLNGRLYRWNAGKASLVYDGQSEGRTGSAIPGTGYDWYIADSDGIFGVNQADDAETLLCSFGNSSLFYNDVKKLYAVSEDVFLVQYRDRFTENMQYLVLKQSGKQIERVLLRMAWLSTSGSVFDTMQSIVSLYNASGTEYFIEISNYGKYGFSGTNPEGLQKFQKDLLGGVTYDLYAMDSYQCSTIFSTMEKNGSLTPLDSLTGLLLPSFANAYRTENGTFAVPYAVSYYMLACPVDRQSTLSAIAQEAETAAQSTDTILCSSPFYYDMADVYAHSMLRSDTCDFTSETFLSLLQTAKTVSETWSERYGAFMTMDYATHTELCITKQSFLDTARDDRMRYLYFRMAEPGMLGVYKLVYDDVPAHLTGLPAADGTSAIRGKVNINLCAPENGNTVGAMAFLSYYLSDNVQQNALIRDSQFSITSSAFDKEMTNRYYTYAVTSFDNINIQVKSRGASAPKNPSDTYTVIEMTDAEMDECAELFRTASISTGRDDMVTQIIAEELEPFFAGNRSAADTAEIIQKRAAIYLAE